MLFAQNCGLLYGRLLQNRSVFEGHIELSVINLFSTNQSSWLFLAVQVVSHKLVRFYHIRDVHVVWYLDDI